MQHLDADDNRLPDVDGLLSDGPIWDRQGVRCLPGQTGVGSITVKTIIICVAQHRFRNFDTLTGETHKARFGISVASLGDINLDGFQGSKQYHSNQNPGHVSYACKMTTILIMNQENHYPQLTWLWRPASSHQYASWSHGLIQHLRLTPLLYLHHHPCQTWRWVPRMGAGRVEEQFMFSSDRERALSRNQARWHLTIVPTGLKIDNSVSHKNSGVSSLKAAHLCYPCKNFVVFFLALLRFSHGKV